MLCFHSYMPPCKQTNLKESEFESNVIIGIPFDYFEWEKCKIIWKMFDHYLVWSSFKVKKKCPKMWLANQSLTLQIFWLNIAI